MRFGLSLSWGSRGMSGEVETPPAEEPEGPFSPADLFASGEGGAWFDIQDFTTMRIALDGSGSAPSVGSVVGRLIDQSGNGHDLVASSDAARPLLEQGGGGGRYLRLDGVDDNLRLALSAPPQMSLVFAATVRYGSWNSRVLSASSDTENDYQVDGHMRIYRNGSNINANRLSADFHSFGAYGAPTIFEITDAGNNVTAGNESGETTIAYSMTNPLFVIGAKTGGTPSFIADMDLYGFLLIDRVLTPSERSDVRSYFADLIEGAL